MKIIRLLAVSTILLLMSLVIGCTIPEVADDDYTIGYIENNVMVVHMERTLDTIRVRQVVAMAIMKLNADGFEAVAISYLYAVDSHLNIVDSIYITYTKSSERMGEVK